MPGRTKSRLLSLVNPIISINKVHILSMGLGRAKIKLRTTTVDINLITPYGKNAKKHPESQVKQIANSIQEFGFNQPIVVDKDKVIIVGHGRYSAALLLGLSDVPVQVLDNLTDDQIKAYRLADNKLNESDWDNALVIEELKELDAQGFDITLTGFDRDIITEPNAQDDVIPEVTEPVAKLGDIYKLGRHVVMCGDSTKLEDVQELMGELKADMIFTDPPYNVDYEGAAGKIKNDKFKTSDLFFQFLLAAFTNMASVTKRGGAAYICHADSEGLNFRKSFIDAGFLLKQCIIWNKDRFVLGRQDYQWKHEPILLGENGDDEAISEHEPILYGWQDGDSHDYYGGRKQSTVWDIPRPKASGEHPTMKPVELIVRAIMNNSKKDDIVLDLFAGSGSTMIAAEKTERIAYLMEFDPKFVDVIIKRYEEYTGNKAKQITR